MSYVVVSGVGETVDMYPGAIVEVELCKHGREMQSYGMGRDCDGCRRDVKVMLKDVPRVDLTPPKTCSSPSCGSTTLGYRGMCWGHEVEREQGIAFAMQLVDLGACRAAYKPAEPYDPPVSVGLRNVVGGLWRGRVPR